MTPPAGPVSPVCQAKLDAYCNDEGILGPSCLDPTAKAFGKDALPMRGLFSAARGERAAWRCWSHLGVIDHPAPHWNTSLPLPAPTGSKLDGYPGFCSNPGQHLSAIYEQQCTGEGHKSKPRTGEDAYFGYRIPGIVYDTKHDTVMAFTQAMYETCGFRRRLSALPGNYLSGDLVLKRSLDGGRSFEPLQVVYNASAHGMGGVWDPTPIYERETGAVFVFFAISAAGDSQGHRISWAAAVTTDGGLHWQLRNMSSQCVPTSKVETCFSGGHGTQLSNGRLVIPMYNLPGFSTCYST